VLGTILPKNLRVALVEYSQRPVLYPLEQKFIDPTLVVFRRDPDF